MCVNNYIETVLHTGFILDFDKHYIALVSYHKKIGYGS